MKYLITAMLLILLTGCTYTTGRYNLSADNVMAAKSWSGVKVNIGDFSDGKNLSTPNCNYKGPIETVDGESYSQYIRNALVTDLKFAEVYSEAAPITISGVVDSIDNSTALGTDWTIVVTLKSSTGKSITIREYYDYNGSIAGTADSTCGASAAAFVPAVQDLVGKIIHEIPVSLI